MANWTSVSVGFVRFALTAIEKFILGITLARRETKERNKGVRSHLPQWFKKRPDPSLSFRLGLELSSSAISHTQCTKPEDRYRGRLRDGGEVSVERPSP
jgi:hypothetical protein